MPYPLTEAEVDALRRGMTTAEADALDEQLTALDDEALAAWLRRGA